MENTNKFEITIGEDKANQRIDKVLSSHPLIGSRSKAAQLIDQNLIQRISESTNTKQLKSSYLVQVGERFLIQFPAPKEDTGLIPFELSLDILFEDSDIIVLNKPANLVVHPAHGHHNDTLVNALVHHTKDLSMGFGENRPGIVHRLDKETSGLLVVAKNNRAHEALALQFKERSIHRVYWALVYGDVKKESGTIHSYLARHPSDRKRFASLKEPVGEKPPGKIAITNFRKLETSTKGFSLLEMKLETGRTHQIRVHLSEMHHPIVGDFIYGAKGRNKNIKSHSLRKLIESLGCIGLHAKELGFVHPTTGEKMIFTSTLPEKLKMLFDEAGFHVHSS